MKLYSNYSTVVTLNSRVPSQDELDLVVLLDHELGEVFGPSVFGEANPRERRCCFLVKLSMMV